MLLILSLSFKWGIVFGGLLTSNLWEGAGCNISYCIQEEGYVCVCVGGRWFPLGRSVSMPNGGWGVTPIPIYVPKLRAHGP